MAVLVETFGSHSLGSVNTASCQVLEESQALGN
jgi:hypothetical protein